MNRAGRASLLLVLLLAACASDAPLAGGSDRDMARVLFDDDLAVEAADLGRCANGVKDGDESDVDCGGSCGGCDDGASCGQGGDCKSATCSGGRCAPAPTCADGARNQDESDVDCGGVCPPCQNLRHCNRGDDCQSGHCRSGQCIAGVPLTLSFAAGVEYPLKSGDAYSVTVGDFDGDKRLDVAATTDAPEALELLLGNGDGTLQAPTTFASASRAQFGLASADFDGDGRADVVVANTALNNLEVFHGRANGLSAPTVVPAFDRVRILAIADVDGDGRLDIAAASDNMPGGGVFLGINNGNGWRAGPTFPGGVSQLDALVAGDLTGDGKADIVQLGAPTVFTGAAMGALRELWRDPDSNQLRIAIALGHLNGDGRLDIVATNSLVNGGSILGYLNDGKGGFAQRSTPAIALGTRMECADFDGDGWDDVVVSGPMADGGIYLGRNDGTFGPRFELPLGAGLRGLTVADLNRDGRMDVIATVSSNDTVVVRLNTTR